MCSERADTHSHSSFSALLQVLAGQNQDGQREGWETKASLNQILLLHTSTFMVGSFLRTRFLFLFIVLFVCAAEAERVGLL